eukprot:scpid71262/ scgid0444/ 
MPRSKASWKRTVTIATVTTQGAALPTVLQSAEVTATTASFQSLLSARLRRRKKQWPSSWTRQQLSTRATAAPAMLNRMSNSCLDLYVSVTSRDLKKTCYFLLPCRLKRTSYALYNC